MRNHSAPLAPTSQAYAALRDLVRTTDAIDGALAVADGGDLRVVSSLRSLIARRTICGSVCPAVTGAILGGRTTWLEPSAPEGLYLPPHTQVLFVPFATPDGPAAALLAYHARPSFSAQDLLFMQRAFGPAVATAALPLAA